MRVFLFSVAFVLMMLVATCIAACTQTPNNAVNEQSPENTSTVTTSPTADTNTPGKNTETPGSSSETPGSNTESPDTEQPLDGIDNISNGIKVLGEHLEGYYPHVDGYEGSIYVPLIPIADKLGMETYWDDSEGKATIGDEITIWAGRDYYTNSTGNTIPFGPAPILLEGELYVSRTFIQKLGAYKTYIADGFVVIEEIPVS